MTARLTFSFPSASCKQLGHFGKERELLGEGETQSDCLHKQRVDFVKGEVAVSCVAPEKNQSSKPSCREVE